MEQPEQAIISAVDNQVEGSSKEGRTNEVMVIADEEELSTVERLCAQCILSANDCIGKPTRPYRATSQELHAYINRIFANILKNKAQLINEYVSRIVPPKLFLGIKVIQGEGLLVVDGKTTPCDAYVIAYLNHATICKTSVQSKTLSPRWNETLYLNVTDRTREILRVEVWRKNPESLSKAWKKILTPKSVRSFFSSVNTLCGTFCRNREDFLVGSIIKPIAEIPSLGIEQWHQLKTEHGVGLFGRLQICLQFKAVPSKGHNSVMAFQDHQALSLMLLQYNINQDESIPIEWNKWEDCLPREALTLLHQHALHLDIQLIERCYSYLVATTKLRSVEDARINYSVHYLLLKELELELKQRPCSILVTERDLLEACQQFLFKGCQFLGSLHENIIPRMQRHVLDLLGLLSCCCVIETLLDKPGESVDAACEAVRLDAMRWHKSLATLLLVEKRHEHRAFFKSTTEVLQQIAQFHRSVNPIFKQAWNETYTEITINSVDEFVDVCVHPYVLDFCSLILKDPTSDVVELSLDLFYVIQRFIRTIKANVRLTREQYRMDDYLNWFGAKVACEWFEYGYQFVIEYIDKVVGADSMQALGGEERCSTSAKETAITIQERFVSLWNNMMWPQVDICKKYLTCVCFSVIRYVYAVEDKAKSEKYYEIPGDHHGISPKICVTINSISCLLSLLETTVQKSVEHCMQLAPQYDDLLPVLLLPIEKSVLQVKPVIARLTEVILSKIEPELMRLLENIVRCRDTSEQDRSLFEVSKYINASLAILFSSLESQVFRSVLLQLWTRTVLIMRQIVSKLQKWHFCRFRNNSLAFSGLLEALHRTRKVYHADGTGLSAEEMHFKEYCEFRDHLSTLVQTMRSPKR